MPFASCAVLQVEAASDEWEGRRLEPREKRPRVCPPKEQASAGNTERGRVETTFAAPGAAAGGSQKGSYSSSGTFTVRQPSQAQKGGHLRAACQPRSQGASTSGVKRVIIDLDSDQGCKEVIELADEEPPTPVQESCGKGLRGPRAAPSAAMDDDVVFVVAQYASGRIELPLPCTPPDASTPTANGGASSTAAEHKCLEPANPRSAIQEREGIKPPLGGVPSVGPATPSSAERVLEGAKPNSGMPLPEPPLGMPLSAGPRLEGASLVGPPTPSSEAGGLKGAKPPSEMPVSGGAPLGGAPLVGPSTPSSAERVLKGAKHPWEYPPLRGPAAPAIRQPASALAGTGIPMSPSSTGTAPRDLCKVSTDSALHKKAKSPPKKGKSPLKKSPGEKVSEGEWQCTMCGLRAVVPLPPRCAEPQIRDRGQGEVEALPVERLQLHHELGVPLCLKCFNRRRGTFFQKVNGHEDRCYWCREVPWAEGVEPSETANALPCTMPGCEHLFCVRCVRTGLGAAAAEQLLQGSREGSPTWFCFKCTPKDVQKLQKQAKQLMALQGAVAATEAQAAQAAQAI